MYDLFCKLYDRFEKENFKNPLHEMLQVINLFSGDMISRIDTKCFINDEQQIERIVEQRKNGIPLEYIFGVANFYGQLFFCEQGALIPRKETELLVATALKAVKALPDESVLQLVDMGTGSGNIAVSIALNTKNTKILASDLTAEAIAIAKKNVRKFKMEDRIELFQGDLFAPLQSRGFKGKIDIVVCNPPYIPTTSLKNISYEIIEYEPREALDGGAFGIGFFRRLIKEALIYLKSSGRLLFEIGIGQEKLIEMLFQKINGYGKVEFIDDGKHIRVVSAIK